MKVLISDDLKIKFQNVIIEWASKNLIKYPWRMDRTPYRILISEILLTRTKANQVEAVYKNFMQKYPTLEEFLKADYNSIFELIKSLGLLYRVQKLVDLISQIREKFKGKIPYNFEELKSLKGIGDYNANAIICFGFNKRRPLLDSNFIRIFNRVFNIKSQTKTPKTDKFLWDFSDYILPNEYFIQFNYGMIDFGSKICSPKNPKCKECFLNQICLQFNR